MPFFETLVPTVDTVRFGYVMELLLAVNHPVFLTGGTGKSLPFSNIQYAIDITNYFSINFSII